MIATSRIAKAQAKVAARLPYSGADHRRADRAGVGVDARPPAAHRAAGREAGGHPADHRRPWAVRRLQRQRDQGRRGARRTAAVAGQGAGARTSSAERAWAYYNVPAAVRSQASWTGFSERPTYVDAETGRARRCCRRSWSARPVRRRTAAPGIDEIHLVSTHFVSMITQLPQRRAGGADGDRVRRAATRRASPPLPPTSSSRAPRRCWTPCCRSTSSTRIYAALLDAAASESAARRAGLQGRHRQRQRHHQEPEPAGQPGPAGADHPGTHRDRRRRRRPRRLRKRRGLIRSCRLQ